MILRHLGEFKLIERLSRRIKLSSRVIKGIGDDAAVLKYKRDKYLLFTTDMLVEEKHFHRRSGGYLIGRKAVCSSISDIAAMGGLPRWAVISLGVPGALALKFIDDLYRGMRSFSEKFGIDLAGGDTVGSREIIINIAMLGEVEKKNLVLRSGSREGDGIFVTGSFGGSLKGKHLRFTPRLKEARFLVKNFKVNSMIDVSDGLAADLGHILESSRVGCIIYEEDIPISKNARTFDSAIKEGEDFELVFTMPESQADRLTKKWPFDVRLSKIGRVCNADEGFNLVRKIGKREKMEPAGYTHF